MNLYRSSFLLFGQSQETVILTGTWLWICLILPPWTNQRLGDSFLNTWLIFIGLRLFPWRGVTECLPRPHETTWTTESAWPYWLSWRCQRGWSDDFCSFEWCGMLLLDHVLSLTWRNYAPYWKSRSCLAFLGSCSITEYKWFIPN